MVHESSVYKDVGQKQMFTSLMHRRQSIFAESYNPEEDEENEEVRINFPKTNEEKERILEDLKNKFLFRYVSEDEIGKMIDAMFKMTVCNGETVIRQGEDGNYFYLVESGTFEAGVLNEGISSVTQSYSRGSCFGELALMYNVPSAMTVTAADDGTLWVLDRLTFKRTVLKAAYRKRILYESLIEKVPLLGRLTAQEKMSVADALVEKVFQNGERIVSEGERVDGVYFVVNGEVLITQGDPETSDQIELKRVNSGEYFGELSLIKRDPCMTSASAVGRVYIAYLEVDAFERLLGPCIEIVQKRFENYRQELSDLFGSALHLNDSPTTDN